VQELVRGVKSTNATASSHAAYVARRAWHGSIVRGGVANALVNCVRHFEQQAKCDVPALEKHVRLVRKFGKRCWKDKTELCQR